MPHPPAAAYEQRLEAALVARHARGMLRSLDPAPPAKSSLVDFSSNDYISFARSRELRHRLLSALKDDSKVYGPPSSRLLDGNSPAHAALEHRLAQFFLAHAALLFNSGFDANVGLWTCLADKADWIVFDELVHASMHDGMRASRVPSARRLAFKHNSAADLARTLDKMVKQDEGVANGTKSVWIGVESLYSMDGDLAPLLDIVETVERALPCGNGHVIVDEAHSTGLYGPKGRGLVCALGLEDRVLVRVHTFGKAMACSGAAVLASPLIRNYLINYARPLIYSTAMTHLSVLAIDKSLEMLEQGRADEVHSLATRLVTRLAAALPETGSNDLVLPPHLLAIAASAGAAASSTQPAAPSSTRTRRLALSRPTAAAMVPATSPIVPLLTRSPRPLSAYLRTKGYLVRPITYPTVPRGEERIRVCLHAENTAKEVDGLVDALREWMKMKGLDAREERRDGDGQEEEREARSLAKKAASERRAVVAMKARL